MVWLHISIEIHTSSRFCIMLTFLRDWGRESDLRLKFQVGLPSPRSITQEIAASSHFYQLFQLFDGMILRNLRHIEEKSFID
jgi:hypothetical protein